MELKEQQQALLDAVAEEGRAAVLRTQTLHETYQTSVKHTVQVYITGGFRLSPSAAVIGGVS
eukprot:COSAG01_NODE_12290_length_1765_cov_1.403361_4_plen_62_part_00